MRIQEISKMGVLAAVLALGLASEAAAEVGASPVTFGAWEGARWSAPLKLEGLDGVVEEIEKKLGEIQKKVESVEKKKTSRRRTPWGALENQGFAGNDPAGRFLKANAKSSNLTLSDRVSQLNRVFKHKIVTSI